MRAIAFGLLFLGTEIGLPRIKDPVTAIANIVTFLGCVVCIVGGW